MQTTKTTTTQGNIEISMTVPWADIAQLYEQVVAETAKAAEVPGFRKGKAPKSLVEEKVDESKVYEEVIKRLIPKAYADAVAKEAVRPIVSPKIELKSAKKNEDWIIVAHTCQRPAVTLGDYKAAIINLKGTQQKKIWTPGSGQKPPEDEKDKKQSLDEILGALLPTVTISLPTLLVEHEVNRLLSELIDQTKQLGLTVEQYLASTGRSTESVRKEYEEQAKRTLTLEFALEDIADKEGIFVSDDDIDKVLNTAKTDEERKRLEQERYYLASLLRRQKTLDFLTSL